MYITCHGVPIYLEKDDSELNQSCLSAMGCLGVYFSDQRSIPQVNNV